MASQKEIEDAAKHGHSVAEHRFHLGLLGGTAVAGSVIAAPYVLPAVGIGQSLAVPASTSHFLMGRLGAPAAEGALGSSFGSGIAGTLQGWISSIPGIGGMLTSESLVTIPGLGVQVASGALATVAIAGGLAIGGMLLANHMEKSEDPNAKGIQWSKVIRYGSLATSMLISLPSLLTGISIGIAFIATQFAPEIGLQATEFLRNSLGATTLASNTGAGVSGLATMVPHLFTCGVASLPVVGSFFLGNKHKDETLTDQPERPETKPCCTIDSKTVTMAPRTSILQKPQNHIDRLRADCCKDAAPSLA